MGTKVTLFMENFPKMTKNCTELQNFGEICTENRYRDPNDDNFWLLLKKNRMKLGPCSSLQFSGH